MNESEANRKARAIYRTIVESLLGSVPPEDATVGQAALDLEDGPGAWHSILVGFCRKGGGDVTTLVRQEPKLR